MSTVVESVSIVKSAPPVIPVGAVGVAAVGDAVGSVQSVLGAGVVLLPIRFGHKTPSIPGWQKVTLERMFDQDYRAALCRGNIGVLLGKPSGGICAIDIDDDAAVERFLELNPKLRTTFRTVGSRGCQIWVKITDDEIPKLAKLMTVSGVAWGEWRGDGGQSVVYGRHPKGMDYRWEVDNPAVEISFDEIVWPTDLKLPWPDRRFRELVAEVGYPTVGKVINVSFLVRVFMMRNAVAVSMGVPCIYDNVTGLWRAQDETALSGKLWVFVRSFLDEIGATGMKERLKQASIDELVKLLRIEAQSMPARETDRLVHVRNGMLCLTGEAPTLSPFSPDYGSLHRVDIDYLAGAECPRFHAWLNGAMDADDVVLFQEWFGAVLIGRNLAQRLLLVNGDAGSGKSQLLGLIERVIGTEFSHQLRVSQLGGRFEMREYANKRLLTGKDVGADFLTGRNASQIKSLTGGDMLTAERKQDNEGVTFRGDFHVAIVSNDELTLRVEGDADAWERRLLSIHMKRPPEMAVVPDFSNVILREEGTGILAWAVEGARRHLRNNYCYDLTTGQRGLIERIVSAADGVRLFAEEMLLEDDSGEAVATMDGLYEAYDAFAKKHDFERYKKPVLGRKLVPVIKSKFGLNQRHDLPSSFLKPGGSIRGFKGLLILENR